MCGQMAPCCGRHRHSSASEWTPCGAEDAVCANTGSVASPDLAVRLGDGWKAVSPAEGIDASTGLRRISAALAASRGDVVLAAKVPRVEEPDLEEQCDVADAVDATQDDSDDDTDEIDAADEAAGSEAVS
ncbi:hypothetical protein M885DRAFT_577174 [Pelagophyceae sp. CCMP2097]|nr:hypothetical protein M885DRAFT_577174 [Pelagophyceae sp. CCMP2097]